MFEISSVQEIPEAKKYLMMTFVEIMNSWKAKKMHARVALKKWTTLKTFLIFIRPHFKNVYFVKRFPLGKRH